MLERLMELRSSAQIIIMKQYRLKLAKNKRYRAKSKGNQVQKLNSM